MSVGLTFQTRVSAPPSVKATYVPKRIDAQGMRTSPPEGLREILQGLDLGDFKPDRQVVDDQASSVGFFWWSKHAAFIAAYSENPAVLSRREADFRDRASAALKRAMDSGEILTSSWMRSKSDSGWGRSSPLRLA